jgi:glycosyltransferase involved in cell wall biosynthesis
MNLDLDFLGNAYTDLSSLTPAKRLLHWYKYGKSEGRFPNESTCIQRLSELGYGEFHLSDYLEANPDLVILKLSREQAIVHFLSVGVFEGRKLQISDLRVDHQNGLFDESDNWSLNEPDNWSIEQSKLGIAREDLYVLGRLQKLDLGFEPDLFRSSEFSFIWNLWPDLNNEDFVVNAFMYTQKRCPDSREFESCLIQLDYSRISRLRLFRDLLEGAETFKIKNVALEKRVIIAREDQTKQNPPELETIQGEVFPAEETRQLIVNQGFTLLGRSKYVRRDEWKSGIGTRDQQLLVDSEIASRHLDILNLSPMNQVDDGPLLCSVIVSVYNGQKYLHNFLNELTSQTIFDRSEVVFIDACSTDSSNDLITSRVGDCKNVKIIEVDEQISVYEAWNLGIRSSTSPFITNWNVDDSRHNRSLESQVNWLTDSPEADVCYQDVWLSYDSNLAFNEVVAYGLVDVMPPISSRNLLRSNFVHNGPMWRRQLHDNYGYFDEEFRSAADWDFWLRCCFGGAKFSKSPWPTVSYFVNPVGVSTRPGTEGISEANSVRLRYRSGLAYPPLLKPLVSEIPINYLPSRRERMGRSLINQLHGEISPDFTGSL